MVLAYAFSLPLAFTVMLWTSANGVALLHYSYAMGGVQGLWSTAMDPSLWARLWEHTINPRIPVEDTFYFERKTVAAMIMVGYAAAVKRVVEYSKEIKLGQ